MGFKTFHIGIRFFLLLGLLIVVLCVSPWIHNSGESWIVENDLKPQKRSNSTLSVGENYPSASYSSQVEPVRLIVGVDDSSPSSYSNLMRLANKYNGRTVNAVSMNGKTAALSIEISKAAASSFVSEATSSGSAKYAEPNAEFRAQLVPNDPYWNLQWGPKKIQADKGWNTTKGSKSILVAVIDTGVDHNHPDLAANYVPLGYDWVNNDTDPIDDNGHGTHCAGIIAAVLNNSEGIAGLAQVQIMAEKGLDSHGSGSEDELANAIIHAVDQGANVISMSWGGYSRSELLHDAIKYAYDAGALLVAAAGNDATGNKLFPAGYEEVIAVAATDELDKPASFTNYGDWIELAAPGTNIYSTISETHDPASTYPYDYMSGTSMATPHVAGTAALAWSQRRNVTNNWVRLQMRYTADDLGGAGFDIRYGYGRINAARAVEQPPPAHDLIILSLETPPYVEPGTTAAINSTIVNFGGDEANVTVQLLIDGKVTDSAPISLLRSGAWTAVTCYWTPTIEHEYNVTSYLVPVLSETNVANNRKSEELIVSSQAVALLQNAEPWGYPANQKALLLYGIPCVVFDSTMFGSVNLTKFSKVVIASDQDQSFYLALDACRSWFEDYVSSGGTLEIHAADVGYNGGYAPGILPGGILWKRFVSDNTTIVNATHPIVNSPTEITEGELDGWSFSAHGYFTGYPDGTQVVLVDSRYGRPVCLEFKYGSGRIIASGLTLEWGYMHQFSRILENSLLYTMSDYPIITHDVAITNVTTSAASVYQGTAVNTTVVVKNEGNATETFKVTVHFGNTSVETRTIQDLSPSTETVFTSGWNTSNAKAGANYTIWAEASLIMNEVNATNNVYVDGVTQVRIVGDVNGDDRVDLYDAVLAAQSYDSRVGDSRWNSYADLAPSWGVIDIYDMVTLLGHYGQKS